MKKEIKKESKIFDKVNQIAILSNENTFKILLALYLSEFKFPKKCKMKKE